MVDNFYIFITSTSYTNNRFIWVNNLRDAFHAMQYGFIIFLNLFHLLLSYQFFQDISIQKNNQKNTTPNFLIIDFIT